MATTIIDIALTTKHIDTGRRNFARLTVELPVVELKEFLATPGLTNACSERVLKHVLSAGDSGSPQ